ncbi:MAG: SPFH/Band 7/PHB domain protein [Acholeplasmatales bacterium]|nr:SPFH/Band 7/PHB domain protein [Acholeplasmatales bacterium]
MILSSVTIPLIIVLAVVAAIILLILATSIKVVKQTDKYIVQRLGAYHTTWGVGVHFLVPFIDKVAKVITMKEQIRDFDPQSVITKDNVTMQIDTVVYFQITDPQKYAYGIENPIFAIENLSATTLRNIIGELDLDATLTSRDIINTQMRQILDEATDPWGIKVNRVEVKNILPPKDIRDAMEKQMRAERERREVILKAEGEKQSQILIAEGEKQSAILRAEGEKEQMIRLAEGERQKLINLAEGRAEALKVEKEAEAMGIKLVKEAGADNAVLSLKAMEALAKVADGNATKIIVPSEIQNLSGVLAAAKGVVEADEKKTK